jgi:cobalt-precorrin-5B (C1)-methyltransferase
VKKGITTGTCAAAAALAAAILIKDNETSEEVKLTLPAGEDRVIPVNSCAGDNRQASAEVIKDAGITDNNEITFKAGNGVGTVTKPGLQIREGEAAINPVPRQMIKDALTIKEIYSAEVTVSAENGESLAEKTFNPKLGIKGGISIIGTTGIVRPYDRESVKKTIEVMLNVTDKSGIKEIVLVAGNIGEKAARQNLNINTDQIISVGNEWETALTSFTEKNFEKLDIVGHPGKLVKFLKDNFYTHSSEGISGVEIIKELCSKDFSIANRDINTVEEILTDKNVSEVKKLSDFLAKQISEKVKTKINKNIPVSVRLIDMKGKIAGST